MIADEEEVVRALGESLEPSKCELGAETGSSLARVQEKMSPRVSGGDVSGYVQQRITNAFEFDYVALPLFYQPLQRSD